ncbi:JAB domain-containing protein [Vibrio gangliei]|uniref:JAB domain-containing protein n=1 Tax=Vibrio gangliei TaxID=2077090 RepID=UPI000D01462C|nr:DNA repair protein RadC [Vibrio gangliei]
MKIEETLSVREDEVLYLARNIFEQKIRNENLDCTSPEQIKGYLQTILRTAERERFAVILLDENKQFIKTDIIFEGTIDSASVYPREVLKVALKGKAKNIILLHNHPSGVSEPSQADRTITRRLIDALKLIEVNVVDHFIIAEDEITSFRERGFI